VKKGCSGESNIMAQHNFQGAVARAGVGTYINNSLGTSTH